MLQFLALSKWLLIRRFKSLKPPSNVVGSITDRTVLTSPNHNRLNPSYLKPPPHRRTVRVHHFRDCLETDQFAFDAIRGAMRIVSALFHCGFDFSPISLR